MKLFRRSHQEPCLTHVTSQDLYQLLKNPRRLPSQGSATSSATFPCPTTSRGEARVTRQCPAARDLHHSSFASCRNLAPRDGVSRKKTAVSHQPSDSGSPDVLRQIEALLQLHHQSAATIMDPAVVPLDERRRPDDAFTVFAFRDGSVPL